MKKIGSKISYHLLEKSRVCSRERNFHIFYRLLFGAPKTLLEKLFLTTSTTYEVSSNIQHDIDLKINFLLAVFIRYGFCENTLHE